MSFLPSPARCCAALALGLLLIPVHAGTPKIEGEDVSASLEGLRAKAGLPGIVCMAFQEGEVVAWGAAGVRAQGSEDPMTIDDPVHMGSCAKAMTSTMIAHLIEQEVLTWETTLAQAMPEFAGGVDEGYHDITIETFLKHQAGIAERRRPEIAAHHGLLQSLKGTPQEVRLKVLAQVLSTPPSPSAEGAFDYSNFGYMVAGAMVETLTKTTWEELMAKELFGPLEMTSAGIGSPSGEHVPVGHTFEDGSYQALPPGPGGALPEAMGPAGLAHCNLKDWGIFVAEHLAGERGDDGLLTAANYQRLHTDHGGSKYAAGWGLGHHIWSWGEAKTITHNGSDNTWLSLVFAIPEWDLTIMVATNCASPTANTTIEAAKKLLLKTVGFSKD
ncbi:MAG: CubicO group peptidase (beta-lactamase class C family) [Planctomycetota bacterium]|jgi:CubicO group peptidase (beta-lactamase class C family)